MCEEKERKHNITNKTENTAHEARVVRVKTHGNCKKSELDRRKEVSLISAKTIDYFVLSGEQEFSTLNVESIRMFMLSVLLVRHIPSHPIITCTVTRDRVQGPGETRTEMKGTNNTAETRRKIRKGHQVELGSPQ